MAIQNRRGAFTNFDKTKMVPGEFAIVQSGDPNVSDGKAVYIAFQSGEVKQLLAKEDADAIIETKFDELADELRQDVQDIADDIQNSVYSAYITESVSGNPVIINDGANGVPVKSLEVDFEPIQDLNGYDYAWAGGNGKNKLESVEQTNTLYGVTTNVNSDGSVTLNGTATSTVIAVYNFAYDTGGNSSAQNIGKKCVPNGTYIVSGGILNQCRLQIIGSNNPSGTSGIVGLFDAPSGTVTIDDTYAYNWVRLYIAANAQFTNTTIYPMIRLTSESDATYAPYENICPINGAESVTVKRTGRNLLRVSEEYDTGALSDTVSRTYSNNEITFSGISETTNYMIYNQDVTALIKKCGTVTVSATGYETLQCISWRINVLNTSGVVTERLTLSAPRTINYQNGYTYQLLGFINATGTVAGTVNLQLEPGSTATAYEPYNSQTVSINLGGEYYGGTLDIATGELTVTHIGRTFERANRQGIVNDSYYAYSTADAITNIAGDFTELLSDRYTGVRSASERSAGKVYVVTHSIVFVDDRFIDAPTANSILAAEKPFVVYPLATPIKVTLTPQQLTTLLGYNVITTDVSNLDIEYRADTKLYINNNVIN